MDNDISAVTLSSLTYESRNLLSSLLNPKKVIPSDGPHKLPRDWRGLASLVNISSQEAASINECQDRTARVLELWIQRRDGTATVRHLLANLQHIDRHDVSDDLLDLAKQGRLVDIRSQPVVNPQQVVLAESGEDLITYDDVQAGAPHLYDAYVLFAKEDRDFVDELLGRMRAQGFKLCTEDDLLPGHMTKYAPVSKLISERCNHIILIISPDFLNSPANSFYTDYAQAVGIEKNLRKIIPCMYRKCELRSPLSFYSKVYYNEPGQKAVYDFWEKLSNSLRVTSLTHSNTTHSSMRITQLPSTSVSNEYVNNSSKSHLLPICAPAKSSSMNGLNTLQHRVQPDDSKSLSNISQVSDVEKSKKSGLIKWISNSFKGKKSKKAIMIENKVF